jgi:hypothetical protein
MTSCNSAYSKIKNADKNLTNKRETLSTST